MGRRRKEYQGDLVPFLGSVFFGFSINILTAETGEWGGPLRPLTRYPYIWVPICLLAWIGWDWWRRTRRRPSWTGTGSPYPGLAPFDGSYASVFFGRERETGDILTRLDRSGPGAAQRFVMLAGPSGSGKSSLIRAGVLPGLSRRWQVHGPVRIGSDPFGALAAACHPGGDRAHTARMLRDSARRGSPAHLFALIHPETGPTLLVIDPWEDLYTRCGDADRSLFLALLSAALGAHPGLHVLAAMRPEWHRDAAAEPDLPVVAPVPIATLRPAQIREAIERPATAAGLVFDDGLIDTMVVESTAHQADALPLLAHLLQYLHGQAGDGAITVARYDEAGRVGGAIARQADTVYRDLVRTFSAPEVDRALLRGVGVEGGRPVRHPVGLRGLDAVAARVFGSFRDARLMVATAGGEALEFAHEAVFREWPTLVALIAQHQDLLVRRTLLEQRAAAWRASGGQDDLLRGTALEQARSLTHGIEPSPALVEFLGASGAAADQDLRRLADQAAERAQQLEPRDPKLALAVASAAVAELAATPASLLTLWGLRAGHHTMRLPIGHVRGISSAVWLPDGRLRTLSDDGKVCTWSDGRRPAEVWLAEAEWQDGRTLSGCGRFVVGPAEGGKLGLWEASDGHFIGSTNGSPIGTAISWPSRSRFAVHADWKTVHIYEMEDSKPVLHRTLTVKDVAVSALSPAGDHFAVASPGKVQIFTLTDPDRAPRTVRLRGDIEKMKFSPDSTHLALVRRKEAFSISREGTLCIYTTQGNRVSNWPINSHDAAFAWSPDSMSIAYGIDTNDGDRLEVRRREGDSPSVRQELDEQPTDLAWASDGQGIAMFGRVGHFVVFQPDEGKIDLFPGGDLRDISWSADKSRCSVSIRKDTVRIYESGRLSGEVPGWTSCWSPVENLLAVGSDEGVSIHDTDGQVIGRMDGDMPIRSLSWPSPGDHLIGLESDFWTNDPPAVSMWSIDTKQMSAAFTLDEGARTLAFRPDGKRLATNTRDGTVTVRDARSGETTDRWESSGDGNASMTAAWSSDSRRLAVSDGEIIEIHHPESATETVRYIGHTKAVEALCWSPGDVHLFSACSERILMWDTSTGQALLALRKPVPGTLLDLHWHDGLTMSLSDGTILTWQIPLDHPPADLDVEARHTLTADERQRFGLPPT